MSYCSCCQGRGCSRQYIGYFDTYVSNCLSTTCTQVFPNKCIRNTRIGGSISAQFTSYPPQIPSSPLPPSQPKPINWSGLLITLYIVLGIFSVFSLIIIIYWCIDYIQKRRYHPIPVNSQPRYIPSAPTPSEENSPPPYLQKELPKKQKNPQSRYGNVNNDNFQPIYIPVPINEPIHHHYPPIHQHHPIPRHNTPVYIDTYTVTSSTQDYNYTYVDDGYGDISQTDTDNF